MANRINWCCIIWSCLMTIGMLASIAGIVMYSIKLVPDDEKAYQDEINSIWHKSSYVVTNHTITPRRCCRYGSCFCTLASNTSKTCPSMLQNLEAGDCDNGYCCCKKNCQICSDVCRYCTDTRCQYYTCNIRDCACVCAEYVNNQLCNIVCGNCYRVSIIIKYETTNTVELTNIDYECGQDDTGCVNEYKRIYPIGFRSPIWYDPTSVRHVTFVQPVNKEFWPSSGSEAVIVVSSIALIATFITNICIWCCTGCSIYWDD